MNSLSYRYQFEGHQRYEKYAYNWDQNWIKFSISWRQIEHSAENIEAAWIYVKTSVMTSERMLDPGVICWQIEGKKQIFVETIRKPRNSVITEVNKGDQLYRKVKFD